MDPELPPILPNIEDELRKYILCPENLPIHQYERNQQFWGRTPEPLELLNFDVMPPSRTLKVQRDLDTGKIIEFREVLIDSVGADAKNSTSLTRAPVPPTETVRGNASYIPFWPGSFPEPVLDLPKKDLTQNTELLTVPPGFSRGLVFAEDGQTVLSDDNENAVKQTVPKSNKNVVNLLELLNWDQDLEGVWDTQHTSTEFPEEEALAETPNLPEEEEILPKEVPVIKLSALPPPNALKGSEWAILLDTSKPVKDFEKQIPDMAKKFDFELDTFQKLAILQLEQHNHVFVAAHTSAGKTVVAEYAIALSQKHMTRTIYTSPIKALSNQKYRDFKKEFVDVGLITGDFQINQKASCLIMTTEILRSMLYCGSDITRDLEYVIFDEVHYINDRERGHVWEQVLIMLPAHVCVVLLSATVPNTIEFADWLGRTHQRKVFVVTTYKRPVPLQHFLYTGRGGSTKDNRFMILDAETWRTEGYFKAKNALEKTQKESDSKVAKIPGKPKYENPQMFLNSTQEKTLWTALVDHLRRKDLLPVVSFIFSRQKCDKNAEMLTNLDLTTEKEKSQIENFFKRCISHLKEPDKKIPQITNMKDILKRGVGVHHSGVLPIVKEMVEMLFQRGLIKILFATETFAMGVNMPARTVIFDSVKKHDGVETRNLLPAEYIQMAGRAGRRGKDDKGTVIILCKLTIPPDTDLRAMMTGLPNKLVSQFRLTYGMVLSLLRVESDNLSVEGMMSRSFAEADHQKKMNDLKKELEDTRKELEELNKQQLSNYLQPLVKFYDAASAYLSTRKEVVPHLMHSQKIAKVIQPGAIVLITYKRHINKLALILCVDKIKKPFTYKVLVLTDSGGESEQDESKNDLWYQMLSLAQPKLFVPQNKPGHEVLTIAGLDVFEISSQSIKINTDLVLKDWQKRQMERFRDDPPGQSCIQAMQELQKLSTLANENESKNILGYLHFIIDLKINVQELYEGILWMYKLKEKLLDHLPSTQIPNFEHQFQTVFKRKFIEEKKKDLEFTLSDASLRLYPDYQNRIELLQKLDYVVGIQDHQTKGYRVKLKGRVACGMGMNELLITELVVNNTLTPLKAAEVAALLSALVFRIKLRCDMDNYEDEFTPNLKKAIEEIKAIHNRIGNMELQLHITTDEFQQELNFGLVHVVHRWANAEPFAEIMKLTQVQEGIIVRCIQQLNETLMDVRDAARLIGEPELYSKMEEASSLIKRDIVFADSLYTQDDIKS